MPIAHFFGKGSAFTPVEEFEWEAFFTGDSPFTEILLGINNVCNKMVNSLRPPPPDGSKAIQKTNGLHCTDAVSAVLNVFNINSIAK